MGESASIISSTAIPCLRLSDLTTQHLMRVRSALMAMWFSLVRTDQPFFRDCNLRRPSNPIRSKYKVEGSGTEIRGSSISSPAIA